MKSKSAILSEIGIAEKQIRKLQNELEKEESKIEPQIKPLSENIDALKKELEELHPPKLSPIYTVCIIGAAITLMISLILGFHQIIKLLTIAFLITTIVVRKIAKKKLNKPFETRKKNKENSISKLNKKIDSIRNSNPKIAALEEEIDILRSTSSSLNRELKIVEFNEVVGTNNVIVSVYPQIYTQKFRYYVSDIKGTLFVDGDDKGIINQPFKILKLSPGIHSLSIRFVTGSQAWKSYDIQFSVHDDNKFYHYTTFFDKEGSFDFEYKKFETSDEYFTAAKLSSYEAMKYIKNL